MGEIRFTFETASTTHSLTDSNDAALGGQLGDVAVRMSDNVPELKDGAQPAKKRERKSPL